MVDVDCLLFWSNWLMHHDNIDHCNVSCSTILNLQVHMLHFVKV